MPNEAGPSVIKLVVDTHVHIYPQYDFDALLTWACKNLSALFSPATNQLHCLCLTERSSENFYRKILNRELRANNWSFAEIDPLGCIKAESSVGQVLYLFAGHQVRTSENIEVLALAHKEKPADGQSLNDTISSISKQSSVVVPWSPGKWLGTRGEILKIELQRLRNRLILGDILLRPAWTNPALMQEAKRIGCVIFFGSDPLPCRGEEKFIGRMASSFSLPLGGPAFDEAPVQMLRQALNSKPDNFRNELSLFELGVRLMRSQLLRFKT